MSSHCFFVLMVFFCFRLYDCEKIKLHKYGKETNRGFSFKAAEATKNESEQRKLDPSPTYLDYPHLLFKLIDLVFFMKNYSVQYKFFLKKFIIFKLYRKVYGVFFFFSNLEFDIYLFRLISKICFFCFFIVDERFGFCWWF